MTLLLLLALSSSTPLPLDGPVNLAELLRVARQRAAANHRLWYDYAFRQTVVEEALDPQGQVRRTQTSVYDVLPAPHGTERHLVSRDGEEPSESEIRKQEKRNERLEKRWDRMQEKQQSEAEKRAREQGLPPPSDAPPVSVTAAPRPAPTFVAPPAVVEEEADAPPPPELPPCDPDDPARSLRPPRPGASPAPASKLAPPPEDARRARRSPGDYSVFELLSLSDYEYAGACSWKGRPAHVITFQPPTAFDPANPVERVATAMKGTLLIDAADLCIVRAEGRTVAPVKWGAGLVALRAARVDYEYAKVNDEVWLPHSTKVDFDTRVAFDSDHVRFTHSYDDYKKAAVGMETELGGLVNPPVEP